ncbi:MAG: hypothetical protein M3R38_00985 [Actinomycetota bacterium]|nr:hypothetical protein [Actinomycetota bacterium]
MTRRSPLRRFLRPWCNPVDLTFDQFVYELALLRLKGTHFTAADYAHALAKRLGTPVRLQTLTSYVSLAPDSLEARAVRRDLAISGHMGVTVMTHDEGAGTVSYLILYLDDLDWWLREHTLFHELGHVAAGHHRAMPSVPRNVRPLVSRIAERPPVSDLRLQEDEADLRANYSLLAGSLGELSTRKRSLALLS